MEQSVSHYTEVAFVEVFFYTNCSLGIGTWPHSWRSQDFGKGRAQIGLA